MSAWRSERIRQLRTRQPLPELLRKARKARERAKLWTQEELDYAERVGRDLCASLNFDPSPSSEGMKGAGKGE